MWSVVTESPIATRQRAPTMSFDAAWLGRHPVEVRRQPHVRRGGIPGEELALGNGKPAPGVVAGEHVRVGRAEHLLADGAGDRLAHLVRRWPDVREEDVLAVRADPDRLRREVDVHASRRARRRRRAAVTRGSSPSPPDGSAPRSSGCRRARRTRRDRLRPRRARSPLGAGRSSRCTSCSRSRPCGSRAPRGTA